MAGRKYNGAGDGRHDVLPLVAVSRHLRLRGTTTPLALFPPRARALSLSPPPRPPISAPHVFSSCDHHVHIPAPPLSCMWGRNAGGRDPVVCTVCTLHLHNVPAMRATFTVTIITLTTFTHTTFRFPLASPRLSPASPGFPCCLCPPLGLLLCPPLFLCPLFFSHMRPMGKGCTH